MIIYKTTNLINGKIYVGYDTKNAAHLIRLLRMSIEFLNEGQLHVKREDAAELLSIKKGKWKLKQVKEEAIRLFKRAEDTYDRSDLPIMPKRENINVLCMVILNMRFGVMSTTYEYENKF